MSVQIIINGENAQESLLELSALAKGLGQPASASISAPAAQTAQTSAPIQAPVQHPAFEQFAHTQPPMQQTVPTQQAAPMQQPPVQQAPTQPAVPVSSAPQYTIDQLGVAAGPLVDAGRGPELTAWLNQRGAAALTQLDKAHYGEFAMYLRSLGAKI